MKMIWSLGLMLALLPVGRSYAQEDNPLPGDVKFSVQVDLAVFQQTDLGSKLLNVVKTMAKEEMSKGSEGGNEDVLAKVSEAIGFDPLEEIRSLTILGTDFEEANENLRLILQFGSTTGNLEGLALTLPNYESEEYGPYTIHSGTFDQGNAFATIHNDSSGTKKILAATSSADLIEMIKGISQTSAQSTSLSDGVFLRVNLLQLPEEALEGPQANAVKLLEGIQLSLASINDDIQIKLDLQTETEKSAEQFQQLAQGAIAMVSIFEEQIIEEIGDDENANAAFDLLKGLSVQRDGTNLDASLSLPGELIIQFLREEADLPL